MNALWQIPLLAAGAWLACHWMRRGPAAHRHAVCVATLVAALLLPLASIRSGWEATQAYPVAVAGADATLPAASAAATAPQAAVPAAASRTVSLARTTATLLLAAYFLFVAFRLGQLALAWLRTSAIRRSAYLADPSPRVAAAWQRALAAFRLSGAELRWSARIPGPVTAGRTVILPESLREETSEEVLATAIGHEVAHIARRDYALILLLELLAAPISFHPAAVAVRRGIDRTRELACDELVTTRLLEPSVYARSIMQIAEAITGGQPAYTLGVLDGDILEERIRRLMEGRRANLKRARMSLVAGLSAVGLCVAVAAGLAISARAQSAAYPEVKAGVEAYNQGDFNAAVVHFQQAVQLDPNSVNARLHLANALVRRRFAAKSLASGDESVFEQARQQYQEVLSRDPANETAIFGLVSLNGPAQAKESHDLMVRIIARNPANKSAYYAAAVSDWQMAYSELTHARQAAGMQPQDPGIIPDAALRAGLRSQIMPKIEEGYRMLQIALDKDPAYSDAMAYMNLLYRANAMIADSQKESNVLIRKADDWIGKALGAKRREANKSNASAQITADVPPPLAVPAPPPPPPPPPPRK